MITIGGRALGYGSITDTYTSGAHKSFAFVDEHCADVHLHIYAHPTPAPPGTTLEWGWYKSDALTTLLGSNSSSGSVRTVTHTPTTSGEYRALAYCTTGSGASKRYSTALELMGAGGKATLEAAMLSADMITKFTARLNTNYPAAWYHKRAKPTGGTCSSQIAAGTTTAALTGLTLGTEYTYKAYLGQRLRDGNHHQRHGRGLHHGRGCCPRPPCSRRTRTSG